MKLCFSMLLLFMLTACNSQVQSNTEDAQDTASSAMETVVMVKSLELIDRNTRKASAIQDDTAVTELSKAWQARERTYEKLLPLFEYAIKFEHEGQEELWRINKAGYCMKEGTTELYKMNTEALHSFM